MNLDEKDYGAHSFGQPSPELALQRRAIEAAKAHPLYREAAAHVYCEPVVFFEPNVFFEESHMEDELKQLILNAIIGVDRVVLVSF